jgi:hypothetical protein
LVLATAVLACVVPVRRAIATDAARILRPG